MGLSYEDYLSLTPYQFAEAYRRFIEKTNKDREQAELTAWQVARWQVWRTLCPPETKGPISVVDLLELTGDKPQKPKQKELTKEEQEERARKLAEKWK
jgi:hypothetical protein